MSTGSAETLKLTRRDWLRFGLVVALLLTVTVFTGLSVRRYFEVDEVRLPDLRGMTLIDATELLRRNELEPLTYPEDVPGAPVNSVTSQTPEPGSVVRRGRGVSIGVNTPPEAAQLPTLLDLDETEALRSLADLNLGVDRIDYHYSDQPAGRVIGQTPPPGGRLGEGEGVQLSVSKGRELPRATLPDVTGRKIEDALASLRDAGFRQIDRVASSVSFDRADVVTAQRPAAGSTVATSTPVTIFYALPSRTVTKVPALEGQELRRAQLLLRAAGLQLGSVSYIDDPAKPRGVVTANPAAYTVAGSPVSLVFNGPADAEALLPDLDPDTLPPFLRGAGEGALLDPLQGFDRVGRDGSPATPPGAGSRSVPFRFDPTSLGARSLVEQDYDLKLVVDDDRGTRTVLDQRVQAGEVVSATVTVYGDTAQLQTYINGMFYQAWSP